MIGALKYSSTARSRRSTGDISGGFSADEDVLMAYDGRVAHDARNALRDAAQNLVVEGSRPSGEVIDGDLLGTVAADQCHRGAQPGVRRRHVGDVDHQHVHADGADDRNPPTADQHLGIADVPRVAVGVSQRQCGDAGWPRGPPLAPVAHRCSDGDVMDRHDARRQP